MGASPTVTDVAYPRLTGLTSGVRAKPMGPPAYGAEGLLKLRPIEVPITLPAGRDRDPGYQYPLCLAAAHHDIHRRTGWLLVPFADWAVPGRGLMNEPITERVATTSRAIRLFLASCMLVSRSLKSGRDRSVDIRLTRRHCCGWITAHPSTTSGLPTNRTEPKSDASQNAVSSRALIPISSKS